MDLLRQRRRAQPRDRSSMSTLQNQRVKIYTSGPLLRQLIVFAIPFVISNLLTITYSLVDMFFVGQFDGSVGLAAVSLGGEIMHLYTFIGLGITNAAQVLVSQYTGLGDRNAVSRLTGTMITVVIALGAVVTALALCFNTTLMAIINVPEVAAADCLAYTNCVSAGCCLTFGYQVLSAFLRGSGDSKSPMLFVGIATVVNIVLDYFFLSSGMGAYGAALATVIAQGVSFVAALAYFLRNRKAYGLTITARDFLPDRKMVKMLIKLGFPMTLQAVAISVSGLFIAAKINHFGVTAAAVNGVGLKLSMVASIITQALTYAGNTMIAQNFAVRNYDRIRKVLVYSLIIGGIFVFILSLLVYFWPQQVFAIFTDDADVLAMCPIFVAPAIINFVGWAIRGPAVSLCNGLGFARMNLILGLCDGIVMRIGFSLLLGSVLGFGLEGYWIGSAIAGCAFFFVMFPYYLSGKWKNRKPPVQAMD